ncbi:dentin sialophosphoprotein-related [Raphanus sativus]|nr:dentin sialophosphoprotein-related [Raphanus sativus]
MAEVVLHIYDVTNSGSEIDSFYKDGIGPIAGVFHCAIQVYGEDEWSYGCCEQGTGVFSCAITKNPMYAYREKIVLGKTDCTIFMVDQILRELSREWSGQTYDLLSKNCNHFCDVLCGRLGVPKLPGWVNRFANDGDAALEVAEDTKMRVGSLSCFYLCNLTVKEAKAELVSTSKVASSFSNVSSDMTNSSTSTGWNMKMQGTWKMVAKRSRSSTKRVKKQVTRSRDIEAEYKSATSTSAEGDSGSEKLGVSIPGQHFAERVEHVPLKKRRFMVPSPSPLNRSFARGEDSQHRAQINHSLPVSRLNPNLMSGKTSKVFDDKPDCGGHDFYGIKILAEVACSSGMSSEIASAVDGQIVEHAREQEALAFSPNDSSTGTVDVSGKDTTIESSDKVEEGKSKILVPQNASVDILGHASAANQSERHNMVASSSMIVTRNISIAVSNESSTDGPRENLEAGDSRHLATQSELATVSENLSGDERTGKSKNSECITDDRLHWDLNLPTDAWGQPCDVVDEISGRYSDGEVTESITESRHVDGSNDYPTGLIASDVRMNSQLLSGPSAGESVRNGKECQSGYDSQFEDGELREPYPWEENEGDSEDVEQVDYGSEPEKERLYSLGESNENKLEDIEKEIVAETKCGAVKSKSSDVHEGNNDVEKHVVVCMNNSHSKGSSPSRSFRPDSYEELSERDAGPNKYVGRERTEMRMQNRSPRRRQFSGWDSRRRFSPPIYKGGEYRFGRQTVVEDRVMMSGFDQPGPGPSPGSRGYVRRHFSNGGYQGRFRRFPDGNGNRDFRDANRSFPPGDANDYPSRMHINRMNGRRERSNSPPVFRRRLHDPQSRSRSRSRSPVSWNGRNRSPPGFRGDENRMERVRFPFQKRFPLNQETGFMLQQRNQRNSRFFDGRNKDGGWENHHNDLRGRTGRMFRSEQRFDNMRRVNSENNSNFRPFVRHNNNNSRRFDDDGGSRGEGFKYKGAEEKNEYEMMVHRPQTMEEDGGRLRLDGEQLDTLVSKDNKNNNEASLTK